MLRAGAGEMGIWDHALDLIGRGFATGLWAAALTIGFFGCGLSMLGVAWSLAQIVSLASHLIRWN